MINSLLVQVKLFLLKLAPLKLMLHSLQFLQLISLLNTSVNQKSKIEIKRNSDLNENE